MKMRRIFLTLALVLSLAMLAEAGGMRSKSSIASSFVADSNNTNSSTNRNTHTKPRVVNKLRSRHPCCRPAPRGKKGKKGDK